MMSESCRIELLGGLRVRRGEHVVAHFRTHKTGALLAYLACHRGAQPREVLADLLWPDSAPELGRQSLRVELSSLRRLLEPPGVAPGTFIEAKRAGIELRPAVVTDVEEFQNAWSQARQGSPTQRRAALERVLSLYSAS